MRIVNFIIIFYLLSHHTTWALSPSRTYDSWPFDMHEHIHVDSLTIRSADSMNIHVWHFHSTASDVKSQQTTLYFLHPGIGNMSNYITRAVVWAQQGYNVVLFDYRGFGYSEVYHIDEGELYLDEFTLDFNAVVHHMNQIMPHHKSAILAMGIGTIISQNYLLVHKDKMKFAIFEGYVVNPIQYASRINSPTFRKNTLPASAYNFEKSTRQIKTPMLFWAGSEDNLSYPAEIKKYAGHRSQLRHIEYYEGAHLQAAYVMSEQEYGDIYIKKCLEFIKKLK